MDERQAGQASPRNQSRQQSKSKTQPRPQSSMLKKTFKSSTLKHSFNYKAQQAALIESANVASSSKASSSKTAQTPSEVSNRSFLIFNFNDEADQSYIQTGQNGQQNFFHARRTHLAYNNRTSTRT